MPISNTKSKNAAIAAKSAALPKIPKELLDQFVSGPMTGEAVNAASMAFKKALIERALGPELGHHLGYPNGAVKPEAVTNQRNGTSGKTVLTQDGPLRIEVPRDRDAAFEPLLIAKHERRFTVSVRQSRLEPIAGVRNDGVHQANRWTPCRKQVALLAGATATT